jgi:RNA polymerase sigma factor (sigma-70 family)
MLLNWARSIFVEYYVAMRKPLTDGSAVPPVTWDDVAAFQETLKREARALLAHEGNAGTVHTTQLVNSGLKKLLPKRRDWREASWECRDAFFKDAHFAMRRLLIDYARRREARKSVKAGAFDSNGIAPLTTTGVLNLDRLMDAAGANAALADAVDRALAELDRLYPKQRLAEIVQHRCFEQLNQEEIGKMLGISADAIRKREHRAYGLLRAELNSFFADETSAGHRT